MKTYEAAVDTVQHPSDSTEDELHENEFVSILNNDHLRLSIDRSIADARNNLSSSTLPSYEIPFHRSSTTNTSDGLVLPTLKASWTTPSVHLSLRSCSNATTRRSSVAKKVGDSRIPHSCRWFVGVACLDRLSWE